MASYISSPTVYAFNVSAGNGGLVVDQSGNVKINGNLYVSGGIQIAGGYLSSSSTGFPRASLACGAVMQPNWNPMEEWGEEFMDIEKKEKEVTLKDYLEAFTEKKDDKH